MSKYVIDDLMEAKPNRVIVGLDDDGQEVGFTILGTGSDEYAQAETEVQARNIMQAAQRKRMLDMTQVEDAEQVARGAEVRKMIFVKRCVTGWFGFKAADGTPAEFTAERAQQLLKKRPRWLDQVINALEDDRAFTGG